MPAAIKLWTTCAIVVARDVTSIDENYSIEKIQRSSTVAVLLSQAKICRYDKSVIALEGVKLRGRGKIEQVDCNVHTL